jgi:hypothetical protein
MINSRGRWSDSNSMAHGLFIPQYFICVLLKIFSNFVVTIGIANKMKEICKKTSQLNALIPKVDASKLNHLT